MWGRIESAIYRFQEIVISLALVVILITVLLQIVSRNLGWQSLGLPEYAAVSMTVMTFLGASALTYSKEYIAVELAQVIKSEKTILFMSIFANIAIITFALLFVQIAYNFFSFVVSSGEKTLEVGIPLGIPYGVIVISMVLMAIHSVSHLIKDIVRLKRIPKEVDL